VENVIAAGNSGYFEPNCYIRCCGLIAGLILWRLSRGRATCMTPGLGQTLAAEVE